MGGRSNLGSLPMRAIKLGFWAIFLATAALSFLVASLVDYHYSLAISLATYSSVLQGLGLMVGAAALGLVLRRERLSGEIRTLEARTLKELTQGLGWPALAWGPELERRMENELLSYQAQAPPPQAAPPPEAQAVPPRVQAVSSAPEAPLANPPPGVQLESELDELLETIMVEGEPTPEAPPGPPQAEGDILLETVQPDRLVSPPVVAQSEVLQVTVETGDFLGALREHRSLVRQRKELVGHLFHPLAMNSALLGVCAFALPAAEGFLAANPLMNTAAIFFSTYGAVVSLGFTAITAAKLLLH